MADTPDELELDARASLEKMGELHGHLAEVLRDAIKPEPIVADVDEKRIVVGHRYNSAALNVARQFLKDNGIEATRKSKQLAILKDELPFDEDGTVVPIRGRG